MNTPLSISDIGGNVTVTIIDGVITRQIYELMISKIDFLKNVD